MGGYRWVGGWMGGRGLYDVFCGVLAVDSEGKRVGGRRGDGTVLQRAWRIAGPLQDYVFRSAGWSKS